MVNEPMEVHSIQKNSIQKVSSSIRILVVVLLNITVQKNKNTNQIETIQDRKFPIYTNDESVVVIPRYRSKVVRNY